MVWYLNIYSKNEFLIDMMKILLKVKTKSINYKTMYKMKDKSKCFEELTNISMKQQKIIIINGYY